MNGHLSKTQIDNLGGRLRVNVTEADFLTLNDYRNSFSDAYDKVVNTLKLMGLDPTGRPAKSTTSIIDKLHRESIRLSQMQDIAGCRIVVLNAKEQDSVVGRIRERFTSVAVVDRRMKPNYGYRAVHLIVKVNKKPVEIQVRTELQHSWAELSEKFSDKIDPAIKYGGGKSTIQKYLTDLSRLIKTYEAEETHLMKKTSSQASGEEHRKMQYQMNIFKSKIKELTKFFEEGEL